MDDEKAILKIIDDLNSEYLQKIRSMLSQELNPARKQEIREQLNAAWHKRFAEKTGINDRAVANGYADLWSAIRAEEIDKMKVYKK